MYNIGTRQTDSKADPFKPGSSLQKQAEPPLKCSSHAGVTESVLPFLQLVFCVPLHHQVHRAQKPIGIIWRKITFRSHYTVVLWKIKPHRSRGIRLMIEQQVHSSKISKPVAHFCLSIHLSTTICLHVCKVLQTHTQQRHGLSLLLKHSAQCDSIMASNRRSCTAINTKLPRKTTTRTRATLQ